MFTIRVCVARSSYLVDHTGALSNTDKNEAMKGPGTKWNPYQVIEVPFEKEKLDEVFLGPNVYAPHEFKNNSRSNVNYLRTHWAIIDFDSGIPADEVEERLSDKHPNALYYINFSSNSQPDFNKYHVILPMDRPAEGEVEFDILADWITQEFDDLMVDQKVNGNRAMGIIRGNRDFPTRIGGKDPIPFDQIVLEHHQREALKAASTIVDVKSGKAFKVSKKTPVQLEDQKGPWKPLGDLNPKTKPRILCPVCGHNTVLRSGKNGELTHNATYSLNDKDIPIVYCASCESRGYGSGGKGVYNLENSDIVGWVERLHGFNIFRDMGENRYKLVRVDKVEGGYRADPIVSTPATTGQGLGVTTDSDEGSRA